METGLTFNGTTQWFDHIDSRSGTFIHCQSVSAALIINTRIGTPRTLIDGRSCNAQRTIGMITVRAQHITFVQMYRHRVNIVISIPKYIHMCFVFVCVRLIRIWCLLAHDIFLIFDSCWQRHMRAFDIHDTQETGVRTLWPWQILNFQFDFFRYFIRQKDNFILFILLVVRTRLDM